MKKEYKKPELIRHGKLEDQTQTGNSQISATADIMTTGCS